MANKRKSKALIQLKDPKGKKPTDLLLNSKKQIYSFIGEDGKKHTLTAKEKLFAEMYLEYQGNGTDAAIEAGYNVTNNRGEVNRNLAKSIASENLTKPDIFAYVTKLLARYGFDSENVEKQHLFLINQFGDLSAKGKGIDMYYKRFGLYPKDQAVIDALSKYKNMPDDELEKIIEGVIVDE